MACSSGIKMYIMVAKELKNGIGYKGQIPWPRLQSDMKFMETMSKQTQDKDKQNAVIMGRRTWESIPKKFRPLSHRFNIVLTSRQPDDIPSGAHLVCNSLSAAIDKIQAPPLNESIESIWIFGGSSVYEEAMKRPECARLYVTEVLQEFPVDTYFPAIHSTLFETIDDPDTPQGELCENGVKFKFVVYQRQ